MMYEAACEKKMSIISMMYEAACEKKMSIISGFI